MNVINVDSYEIKSSRTEQKIPVINGVHLHSIYNPYKEAEALVEKHLDSLNAKSEVLILGLGFAYHVNEIIETLTKAHGDKFKIIVIEPNINVYNDCIELGLLNKKNVLIYAGFTAKELYSDIDLIQFLLKKPTVIAHPPSFNLYQIYFKNFLTYEAPKTIGASQDYIAHDAVKRYLSSFESDSKLSDILNVTIPEKSRFDEMDFIAMALAEMTKATRHNDTNKNGDL